MAKNFSDLGDNKEPVPFKEVPIRNTVNRVFTGNQGTHKEIAKRILEKDPTCSDDDLKSMTNNIHKKLQDEFFSEFYNKTGRA